MFGIKLKVVFSSVLFLVYFLPFVLLLYILTPRAFRNGFLLITSILFYSWGAPRFIFVILGTTFLDFFLVREMDRSADSQKRKLIMALSVCMNLGLLFYFKYCNFFIENVNAVFTAAGIKEIGLLKVVLPIGISFYTFESLTYVIDVYRRVHAPLKNFWHYQLYIILFPKLIAGPIVRYHEIADQITDRSASDNLNNKFNGFFRFVIGLSKKVFIANTMAQYADMAFNVPAEQLSAATSWLGVLAYTFQIYFDFSGYSDMALGLALMFGFRLPENFNNPYTSQSITEFWRRWHITLGNWMKNYLYIPLGGNRVDNPARLYFNLWLVFLASGLWHGAAWTFVFWGAFHGSLLVLERLFLLDLYKKLGRIIPTLITFFLVMTGWVFFRAETLPQAIKIISKMFFGGSALPENFRDTEFFCYLALAAIFSFGTCFYLGQKLQDRLYSLKQSNGPIAIQLLFSAILLTLAVAALAASDFNPFIYFRF
jgi:alginate O-acetyltransferase complex protein AlgI